MKDGSNNVATVMLILADSSPVSCFDMSESEFLNILKEIRAYYPSLWNSLLAKRGQKLVEVGNLKNKKLIEIEKRFKKEEAYFSSDVKQLSFSL